MLHLQYLNVMLVMERGLMGVHHTSTEAEVGLSAAPCGPGAPVLALSM